MLTECLLIGAGGHSKVVIETIRISNSNCQLIVGDQDITKAGTYLLKDVPVVSLNNWPELPKHYHITIGVNYFRRKCNTLAQKYKKIAVSIIHPDSQISPSSVIGNGSFIAARSLVAAETIISEGCIINHGAIIDHECIIGEYSHIAPNVTVGGGVNIGKECLIGAGATILPLVKIGNNVTVGAGAVITENIHDNQKVVGVPGRNINEQQAPK